MKKPIMEEFNILKNIMQTIEFYVCMLDYNGKFIYINYRLENILSDYDVYDADYFLNKFNMRIMGHKLDFDFIKSIDYSKGEGNSITVECTYNEITKYLLMNIDIAADKKAQYILSFRDISHEYVNKMETQLEREKYYNISTELQNKSSIIKVLTTKEKEHLMHLKDVINNISEGILVMDNNGRLNLYNNAVYGIIERAPFDIINYGAVTCKFEIMNADNYDKDIMEKYLKSFKAHKSVRNLVLLLKNKTDNKSKYVELNSNPIQDNKGNIIYTIITIKDITESKEHQIAFENQAKFVSDVIDTIDVPIAVINYPDTKYNLVNRKFAELKEKITDYITEEDISNAAQTGKEHILQPIHMVDKYNNEKYYKIKLKPYKSEDCKIRIHVYGIDVTDEINHTRELEKINTLKDEFFTMTSHELRTPITIIYSSLQLANSIYKDEITPNIQKTLLRIDQNCSRLLKLVNNILDISKAEAGFLTVNESNFDLVETTESIVNSANFYAENKEIALIFDTNIEECPITLDKDKYEKILLNLLSNAIKFTPNKKQILVTLNIEYDCFYLSVKDEGIGIPKNKIDYIFDRFAQVDSSLSRRAEGTGLGLALTKKLVSLMNAEINVISEEGKGSEFIVKFKKEYKNDKNFENCNSLGQIMNDKVSIEFSDIN